MRVYKGSVGDPGGDGMFWIWVSAAPGQCNHIELREHAPFIGNWGNLNTTQACTNVKFFPGNDTVL